MNQSPSNGEGIYPRKRGRLFASLFSGAGIGDLGYRGAGLQAVAMCEIEEDRSALSRINFPDSAHLTGDVCEMGSGFVQVVHRTEAVVGSDLFLLSCTAPCQGMSKSGQGTLLKNIREGKRPVLDPRNALILPALDIIVELQPLWIVFENVIEMRSTSIMDRKGNFRPILDIIAETLGANYVGSAYDVEFADYGIPQRRQRLITVFTRDETAKWNFNERWSFIPPASHDRDGRNGKLPWVSVVEALKGFPPLDASTASLSRSKVVPFHHVPVLDAKKYEWVRHTKAGESAFNNQCINPECMFQGNPIHGNISNDGINQSKRDTPLYCVECGSLLPRPYAYTASGEKRIMSGFTSAYKRMSADSPSPALTRNFSYACSDNKVHPHENRVLSLAEAMKLQTISDYKYKWGPLMLNGRRAERASDGLIRLVIGESVPPSFTEQLASHLIVMSDPCTLTAGMVAERPAMQLSLL